MKGKILVTVYVPMIEKEYDIYIPTVKRIGTIKNLIIKAIEEDSDGMFKNDGTKFLFDKKTGDKLDDMLFVKNSSIVNSSRLVLY